MQTIRSWLLVGKYMECLSRTTLANANVGAILQLAAPVLQTGYQCKYIPIVDGDPLPGNYLKSGVKFIRDQKAAGKVVLVACMVGKSRSVTFALAALHEEEGLPLLEAYRSLYQHHDYALPHRELWNSLCVYYDEHVPYQRVLEIAGMTDTRLIGE